MVVLQVLCYYEFMIEIGSLMSENQVKKSLSYVASPHLTQLGEGALHIRFTSANVSRFTNLTFPMH